jgi:hypothetical protein
VKRHKLCPPEYRIRKRGRLWEAVHVHCDPASNHYSEHVIYQSSDWALLMYVATGDSRHNRYGYRRMIGFC